MPQVNCTQNAPQSGGCHSPKLNRDGNTIRTPRYDIVVTPDKVRVFDRETETWFEAWGDPHIGTSDDGNRLTDFSTGNVTVDLADGTKITIIPTAVNENGVSWVDKVAVMIGDEAVLVENIHGPGGPQFGQVGNGAESLDAQFADGTVLYVGSEADDLFLRSTGEELTNGLYGNIDGKGGVSQSAVGDDDGTISSNAERVLSRGGVFAGLMKAFDDVQSEFDQLSDDIDLMNEATSDLAGHPDGLALGELFADKTDPEGMRKDLASALGIANEADTMVTGEMIQASRQKIQLAMQQLSNDMQEILTTIANLSKTMHDTAMAIINNF
ncbi:MAG: DUF1521 domain-containing protein [Planctomycetes bacterium]|nr:DUF1521 domain-containing protein [Planctomycetota bacterium]